MFNQNFYFSTIRKYVTLFGTLFDTINVIRTNSANKTTAYIKVPITYAPKEKMLARITQDPTLDRQTAVPTLPLMTFEMTNLAYDSSRKLNTIGRSAVKSPDNNSLKYQYNPVPYNFGFRLYIYVKNAEDGTKIVEQILPYFTPDWTTTVKLIPEMDITLEIPLILNTVQQDDTYSGGFAERQAIIWTLDFVMKGYIYGPVKTGKIIKFANSVFYTPQVADGMLRNAVGNTSPVSFVQVQPGLLANGNPTSNASLSIDPNLIEATDDYGFVIEKTDI
jgi:hypothetical protein